MKEEPFWSVCACLVAFMIGFLVTVWARDRAIEDQIKTQGYADLRPGIRVRGVIEEKATTERWEPVK